MSPVDVKPIIEYWRKKHNVPNLFSDIACSSCEHSLWMNEDAAGFSKAWDGTEQKFPARCFCNRCGNKQSYGREIEINAKSEIKITVIRACGLECEGNQNSYGQSL